MASNVPAPPAPITNPTTGATEVYTAQPKGAGEPVVIATSITAILVQVGGLAAAFGFGLNDTQQHAIIGAVEPMVVALFALGPIVRGFVTPSWKAKALIDAAHKSGLAGGDKPQL